LRDESLVLPYAKGIKLLFLGLKRLLIDVIYGFVK